MLDTPNAGADRRVGALGAMRVRHHRYVLGSRLDHKDTQLLLGVDLLARIGIGRAGAFGGERLDPVDAARQVGLDGTAQGVGRVHAAHQVTKLRKVDEQFGRHARPHVIAGGDDVGPGHGSVPDELAQADVDEMRHAGAADGGHAALERRAHLRQRANVHVRIDQTRHDIAATKVHHADAGRCRASSGVGPTDSMVPPRMSTVTLRATAPVRTLITEALVSARASCGGTPARCASRVEKAQQGNYCRDGDPTHARSLSDFGG